MTYAVCINDIVRQNKIRVGLPQVRVTSERTYYVHIFNVLLSKIAIIFESFRRLRRDFFDERVLLMFTPGQYRNVRHRRGNFPTSGP